MLAKLKQYKAYYRKNKLSVLDLLNQDKRHSYLAFLRLQHNELKETDEGSFFGFKVRFAKGDAIADFIQDDNYEPDFLAFLYWLGKCSVVIDVGANIGLTSLMAKKVLGNRVKVFAFEPDLENYALLTLNTLILGDSFHGFRLALNSGDNHIEKIDNLSAVAAKNRGGVRISRTNLPSAQMVPAIDLDTFFEIYGITECDLIKIDVEGFEIQVLKGAREVLHKHRPILFLEHQKSLANYFESNLNQLIEFFSKSNYMFAKIDFQDCQNYIAIPNEFGLKKLKKLPFGIIKCRQE